MTVREQLTKMLHDKMLWEEQIETILSLYVKADRLDAKVTSKEFDQIWEHVKDKAAQWLRENAPRHVALMMFE